MDHPRSRWLLALCTLLLAAGCSHGETGSTSPDGSPAAPAGDASGARLVGKWLRPDGGYVLDIRAASEDGKLDVGYFNPNPIHVSQATWQAGVGSDLDVFVELRDTNYPGATYRLRHGAADDRLAGEYTQPALGQTFDVVFVRRP